MPSLNTTDLQNLRRDYSGEALDIGNVDKDPYGQFAHWFTEAQKAEVPEPSAMTLSTIGADGFPHSRVVLLKGIDDGFVFYTNYNSHKAKDILSNPKASINFFWPELARQVRVVGEVEKVSETLSAAYFASRPRASQIGALASQQSAKLASREELEKKVDELNAAYEGREIPKPESWGGFILKPHFFEFWQGRESRLHDRITYVWTDNRWKIGRLYP